MRFRTWPWSPVLTLALVHAACGGRSSMYRYDESDAGGSHNGGAGGSSATVGGTGAKPGTGAMGATSMGASSNGGTATSTGGSFGAGGSIAIGGSTGTAATGATATGGSAGGSSSAGRGGSAGSSRAGTSAGRSATGGRGGTNTDAGGVAGEDDGPGEHLTGVAQKGAFERGSSLLALELDAKLVQTGRTFAATVSDNTGYFAVNVSSVAGSYVELTANGFYYDEVTNDDSAAPLRLIALSHLRDHTTVNVNVLTDLETPRVEYLVAHGATFDNAKAQAQSEVLAAFEIALPSSLPSEELDETGISDADAALLAVSILVQGYLSVSEVSELLSVISQDLREDGTLDDAEAGQALINAATLVPTALVRQRLEARYFALGQNVEFGDFESYIQNFRSVAPYPLVSRVEFPDQGIYGSNVMARSGNVGSGDFSLAARTPAKEPVFFRMTSTGGGIWYYSDLQNIAASNFDVSTGVQEFTVISPGSPSDVHLLFTNSGSARIDVYEGEAGALTQSREISWGP